MIWSLRSRSILSSPMLNQFWSVSPYSNSLTTVASTQAAQAQTNLTTPHPTTPYCRRIVATVYWRGIAIQALIDTGAEISFALTTQLKYLDIQPTYARVIAEGATIMQCVGTTIIPLELRATCAAVTIVSPATHQSDSTN